MSNRLLSSPVENSPAWGGRWYVASTHPGQAVLARNRLALAGFDAFLPATVTRRIVHGRKLETEKPVLGGYLFVRLLIDKLADPTEQWVKARYCEGVKALLPSHMLRPLPVPEQCVSELRARIDAGEFNDHDIEAILRRYVPGESVRVTEGPLSGLGGEVIRQRESLVRLLISCVGAAKVVTISAKHLAPAG